MGKARLLRSSGGKGSPERKGKERQFFIPLILCLFFPLIIDQHWFGVASGVIRLHIPIRRELQHIYADLLKLISVSVMYELYEVRLGVGTGVLRVGLRSWMFLFGVIDLGKEEVTRLSGLGGGDGEGRD